MLDDLYKEEDNNYKNKQSLPKVLNDTINVIRNVKCRSNKGDH